MNRLKVSDFNLYKRICALSLEVKNKSRELKIRYRLLSKKKHPLGWLLAGAVGLIATFPLFLYGNLFNLTLLEIPNLQSLKIKDVQFRSSIKFGISVALSLVITPLVLILLLVFVSPWWLALLIFISLPVAGLFAWNYYLVAGRITGGFRIRKYLSRKNRDFLKLKKDHDELLNLVASL